MGLQKGQSGYAFRWLMPIFSLFGSLMLFINAIVLTIIATGASAALSFSAADLFGLIDGLGWFSVADQIITVLNLYVAVVWIGAVLLLALAILGFVMNKKPSYIFGAVAGGLTALVYLIKAIIYFVVYSELKVLLYVPAKTCLLLGVYMLFIFAIGVCICLFGALAIGKCDYDRSPAELHVAGQNLTYVGFENDPSRMYDPYHDKNAPGPVDPYNHPVQPEPKPEPQKYVPQGPTGFIMGVKGMYRDARFPITDNEEVVIGRDPRSAQIVIGEGAQNVSRQHCRISYCAADNTYRINDMSKNGTFSSANKARLPHGVFTKVPAGTEIYLGDRSNTFRLG